MKPPATLPPAIFDTALARRRLARAARGKPAAFLLSRVVEDIGERLDTIPRAFPTIADIGTPGPALAAMLRARWPEANVSRLAPLPGPGVSLVGEAERLPFQRESLDLAVSALALQGANDLPGALAQIRQALKPDGLFLGALLGGQTLRELRAALTEAETALHGGASPRVAPFADVRDMGGLLQRAGFALPVADSDTITVRYDTMFGLMADLRAMGATNALVDRARTPARRALFLRAAALYAARFADPDGRVRATFEIVSLSGWAPHESQQKPARRGSATVSLASALGVTERRGAD
jgi:SAM-dependent methyltransferase